MKLFTYFQHELRGKTMINGSESSCAIKATLHDSLTFNKDNAHEPQKERLELHQHVESIRNSSNSLNSPFVNSVYHINENLISNGHVGLPAEKSEQYIDLTTKVSNGESSNSLAFFSSSCGWLKEIPKSNTINEGVERAVGAGMNFLGAISIGPGSDAVNRTLGKN
ncbi:hypothetical protein [Vibrio sp. TBV020]|uniref:hypothetical protein n=1 Tax=Vibrio sp. TBV020 TaxID=3137398 RepID=UPI0038CD9DF2